MKTNFAIEKNYALVYNGRLLDLHNNFDITSIVYDLARKEFKILWCKTNGDWVSTDEADKLELIHRSVSHLYISDKDERGHMEDDSSLDDVTFYQSSHRNELHNIIDRPTPSVGDDILYTLQSGRKIQLCCEEIELLLTTFKLISTWISQMQFKRYLKSCEV
jgi:hypothetical protein